MSTMQLFMTVVRTQILTVLAKKHVLMDPINIVVAVGLLQVLNIRAKVRNLAVQMTSKVFQ